MTGSALDLRLCPGCGYDLRGLSSDRCPECGLAVDGAVDLTVTLPWAHRRQIGRSRAYVRTAWMATAHPRRLAANVARPVSWADAVAFRRVTVALAAGSVAAVGTCLAFLPGADLLAPALGDPAVWWAELLAVPVTWVGLWLAFLTAAGVASYWFHPRSIPVVQQNRAIALSLYGCGPLALIPPIALGAAALALAATASTDRHLWNAVATGLGSAVTLGLLFVAGCWWRASLSLLHHTTHCGVARQLSLGVGVLVLWPVLLIGFTVGPLAAYLWLAVMFKSCHFGG